MKQETCSAVQHQSSYYTDRFLKVKLFQNQADKISSYTHTQFRWNNRNIYARTSIEHSL